MSQQILDDMLNNANLNKTKRLFMKEATLNFLVFLFKILKPKKVLELGSCTGFSSIYLASNQSQTKFISVEHNLKYFELANYYLKKTKLKNLTFIHSDISSYQKTIKNNTFDIVIEDSKKALYLKHLEENIRLLKKGAYLIADDILLDKNIYPEKITKHLDNFINAIKQHKNLDTSIINIGNGISISKIIK